MNHGHVIPNRNATATRSSVRVFRAGLRAVPSFRAAVPGTPLQVSARAEPPCPWSQGLQCGTLA
jgi:hypothetical protein